MQRIQPRERLNCAIELLRGANTVADIGCDHGRLCCALIQQGAANRCIAVDISAPSLLKADRLIRKTGLGDRVETRLGDGLSPLAVGAVDAIAILGMGGTLMTQILNVTPPLLGAKKCILQPMRAAEDIRRWLYERNYPVLEDRVVLDAGRHYQMFSVGQPEEKRQALPDGWPEEKRQALPDGWPEDCFLLGFTAFLRREALMRPLAERMLATTRRKLGTQRAEALERQKAQLEQILKNWEK